MARRATIIHHAKQQLPASSPTLTLGGAQEFFDKRDLEIRPKEHYVPAFFRAYELLGYTRVFVTPEEADWLRRNVAPGQPRELPHLFRELSPRSCLTELHAVAGKKVAVVHFPLIDHQSTPSEQMQDAVRREIAAQKAQCDLVIGMSHWGRQQEFTLLSNGVPGLDILLGAGAGTPGPDLIANNGKTLWARSNVKGYTVTIIQLLAWPGAQDRWRLEENIRAAAPVLEEHVADDPTIKALFHPQSTPAS
ncbi:hypothetical protein DGI_2760 [Megalodesulfovibrio gigas DSM 1382 = ATCC 19364]|uniref:Uncharacterized protein n=1 Tax=Megalodesulfovibrio gigas (strain ATCC 19364 / DSM 1382 / NCIMB 9332 / VKM B-1759) TaxID=1121448 RepID=T2GED8_MEGG1|nr:hypothetical protein [Megalodesulfovibrio gigas]AGW14491.1 hypothetical protein DGI_2760 [Megalodesulfovibrio gigas DSM 1382 = ATCC 19364]